MRILKFGGTSLASAEQIGRVTSIVQRASQHGPVAVVVSALAGVTNALETAICQALVGATSPVHNDLAQQHVTCAEAISKTAASGYQRRIQSPLEKLRRLLEGIALLGECPSATRDQILATGERLSAPLVALAFRRRGLRVRTHDGSSLIATGPSGTTGVNFAATRRRVEEVLVGRPDEEIAVITGFVAGDAERRTTTLGRGASDYSATILGAALRAERIEIWTDVDGVLSAEPRLVPQASPLPYLTYGEAADLACLGARVLHPQCLQPIASSGIPLFIRNTIRPELAGTRVDGTSRPSSRVRAVTALPRVVRFLLRPIAGQRAALRALDRLEQQPLLTAWETPGQTLSVIIPEVDEQAVADALAPSTDTHPVAREELAMVATVDGSGELMSITAPAILNALAEVRIEVKGLFQPAASPWTLAVLVERSALRSAVRLLHRKTGR